MKGQTQRIGTFGWLAGGRHGFEGYLYILHRISGLALLFFLMAHVFMSSMRLLGREAWDSAMEMTHHPLMAFAEYLVFAAFVFHGVNGFRLILIELGIAVGKPIRPVYPYKSSLDVQRKLTIGLMILTAIIIALGGLELLQFSG